LERLDYYRGHRAGSEAHHLGSGRDPKSHLVISIKEEGWSREASFTRSKRSLRLERRAVLAFSHTRLMPSGTLCEMVARKGRL
jgi:hypothetical protein